MILLNAVYFKGFWSKPFKKSMTMKKPFYNLNDKSKEKKVDRMQMTDDFQYYEDKEVQLVKLPYKKDSMFAIIILPNENKNINEFISELNDEKLQRLLKKMSREKVRLELPKFELEFSSSLNSVLKKIGMNDAFNGNTANLNGIGKKLYIDDVIQKTYLKVDESGTEAAAVTAISAAGGCSPATRIPKIYPMIVNRPFLFLLKNDKLPKNNEMLFMSKIETL
jgi:serpin B